MRRVPQKLRALHSLVASLPSRALLAALERLEQVGCDGSMTRLPQVPIFIIGAPRTGSTLLYQSLVHSFDVGYLSNRHVCYFTAPALYERLCGRRQPIAGFASQYGRTQAPQDPHEAAPYFYRFFRRRPQYVPGGEMPVEKARAFRCSLRKLGNAFARPLLFKNMPCALRLQVLREVVPEALYIVMRRDLAQTAASILKAREQLTGSVDNWWSLEIPGIEEIKRLAPEAQVVTQVYEIEKIIDRDLQPVDRSRIFEVEYARFCDAPRSVLEELREHAARAGVSLHPTATLPEHFDASPSDDYWLQRVREVL